MAVFKRTTSNGTISYQAKVRVRGFPPATATFSRKTDADKWAQQIEVEMRSDKYFPNNKARKHTVSELIDVYLNDLRTRNPRRHDEVTTFLDWWKEELKDRKLSNFHGEDVLRGQQKLSARVTNRKNADGNFRKLSPSTVNRYTVALHTAINFGIKPLKWIMQNPVEDVKPLKEPPGRKRYLSKDEIERLLVVCKISKSHHLLPVVIVGIATGARRAEVENIRWEDVNDECTHVTLQKTKNGDARGVHLTGIVQEMVKKMRETRGNDIFLFPSPYNPSRSLNFQSSWLTALRNAKITDFRFHDLRHTCASYLAMNGASLIDIAEILGHRTLQMVRRYAHLSQSHTAGVVANMTGKVLGHVKL